MNFEPTHQALTSYIATDAKCLSCKKGEFLKVSSEISGWAVAWNSENKRGYIPANYLTPYTPPNGFKIIEFIYFI
jgi:hypothetical protein